MRTSSRRTSTASRRPARARRCASTSTRTSTLTVGVIYQDMTANGHSDVSSRASATSTRCASRRRASTTSGTRLALTLNAATAVRRPRRRGLLLRPQVRLPGGRQRLRVQIQASTRLTTCTLQYEFGGDPRGFATEPRKHARSRPSRRGCSPTTMPRAAGPGWPASSTARRPGTRRSTASCTTTHDTPAFAYFDYLQYNLDGQPAPARPISWFLGRYETELEQRAVFGEIGFDVTENFTITAGGRWFEYDRDFNLHQEAPAGFTADSRRTDADRRPTQIDGRRHRREAEPDLPHRRRPHGLCDLVGRFPQWRRQPGASQLDPAARFQSDTLDELWSLAPRPSGWTTGCASTSRPT